MDSRVRLPNVGSTISHVMMVILKDVRVVLPKMRWFCPERGTVVGRLVTLFFCSPWLPLQHPEFQAYNVRLWP